MALEYRKTYARVLITAMPCLKAPFWHQKVRPKPFFFIFLTILNIKTRSYRGQTLLYQLYHHGSNIISGTLLLSQFT